MLFPFVEKAARIALGSGICALQQAGLLLFIAKREREAPKIREKPVPAGDVHPIWMYHHRTAAILFNPHPAQHTASLVDLLPLRTISLLAFELQDVEA